MRGGPSYTDRRDRGVQEDGCTVGHERQRLLNREQESLHIGVERLVEVLLGDLSQWGELAATGVGEQHVHPPVLLLHRCVEPVEIGQVGHVAADPDHPAADLLDRGVQLGLAAAGDDHLGPLCREPLGSGQPDAAGPAGDDRHFVFEFLRHGHLLVANVCTSQYIF
jgi:hypothetical protein